MSGSGKSGNNQRNRHRFQRHDRKQNENLLSGEKFENNKISQNQQERLRWTAPIQPANPISTPNCHWCGKQISDITTAICDKETGFPVHFDCVLARITEMETLGANDSVCYIGGGRFGIIHFNNPHDIKNFSIKKVFEWEVKDVNSEWRRPISEYFSLT